MPPITLDEAPIYQKTGAEEIDGNPLIAHLRLPPETDKEAYLRLALKPQFDESEHDLPTAIRRLRINRLRNFFIPTLPVHRRALIGISSQVFDGYIPRNPLTAAGQRILHGSAVDPLIRPTISFIAGHSGMGKSTLVDRILSHLGNQTHQHSSFNGVEFPERQILWLRRNVPEHCTVRTLCATFGDYTDRILGINLYSGLFSNLRGGDRNLYLSEIRKIITNHHVGLLVLDEFQNLSLMGIGAQKIIAFLVSLRDELGLPIVVVGTYKALRLLERDLSTARRLVEGGYFDLERPSNSANESWQHLCKIAWNYQWVREPIDYSGDICDALYEVSQGITGIMLSAYISAQLAAIENGSECVNADLILKVFRERMKPLHPAVRVLKSGNPTLVDKFDDLYQNLYPGQDRLFESSVADPSNFLMKVETTESTAAPKKSTKRDHSRQLNPMLSSEQIKKMVMTDSVVDLIKILNK